MTAPELQLAVRWDSLIGELFDRTEKFRRAVRYTLARRIEEAALDVLERLVDARYAKGAPRAAALRDIDGRIARLRVLLRFAHARGHLSPGAYAQLSERLDEAGRMVGGLRRREAESG